MSEQDDNNAAKGGMKLDTILRKVRALVERAEHESTPPEEAKLAQQMADALMLKYKLDEAMMDKSRPAASRTKPAHIEVALVGHSDYLLGYMSRLAGVIALHCDCKIRHYSRFHEGAWQSKIYGFPSDLRYFEVLYTTLRLHMVKALRPGLDSSKSVAENAYILHNAGLNWFDMAKLEGWYQVAPLPGEPQVMYVNDNTGERQQWSRCIGKFKRGYAEEIARRGENWMTISPAGTRTYRENAAHGYIARIEQRLKEIRLSRAQIGNALALRVDELEQMFRAENEDLFRPVQETNGRKRAARPKYIRYNDTAYQAGVRQANTAALNPETPGKSTKSIT